MRRTKVRDLLLQVADPAYKEFNDKLTNCDTAPSIGVRVPEIRRIAKEIVKNGWEEYIAEMAREEEDQPLYQEEHMLQGIVIGSAKMDDEARVRCLDSWIPGILSWADCDCSVSSFKFMKKNQEFWFTYNVGWLKGYQEASGTEALLCKAARDDGHDGIQPFCVRYALVAFMQYFINDTYIDRVLKIFAGDGSDQSYYIKMAQAWALSVCFVKYREKTLQLLRQGSINSWVQNKAIQKCRESYRISREDKELLKTLKR